ncbi:MAG: adenylyltransferase/cytidyltransferase family protein [Nanoarchaeota archaeon]|nr:adenylyltransferase/cytidyltransferase family protein [Nanoarchaeota archaeon]
MNAQEILSQIKHLKVYTENEWDEYIDHFEIKKGIKNQFLPKEETYSILERIKRRKGAKPGKIDIQLSSKIVTKEELADLSVRNKMTLGIVSGCFDLLHLGHVRSIAYAKSFLQKHQNPVLCVLVLADENIHAKKGGDRPVLNLNERMRMLCNLRCVDHVIVLEDADCLNTLAKLRPDYFFKNKSDSEQGIVEKENALVNSLGGSVVFLPETSGRAISTTGLIKKIRVM